MYNLISTLCVTKAMAKIASY